MAEKTARGRFVPWSMTKAQLESQNPVPIAGEMVFESDTGRKKIGNGTSAWNALPYVAADNTGAAPASHASSATTYGAASATNYGHAKASAAVPASAGTAAVGTDNAQYARGDHVHPAQTSVTGNAGTATKLATARAINVSGDVTGAAQNFDGSGAITIPTTLANVATAGTTGEAANKTLGYGGTFTVPQITIDAKGRTTAVTARTMTTPALLYGSYGRFPVSRITYRYKWMGMNTAGYYVPLFPDDKTSVEVADTWSVTNLYIIPTAPILYNNSTATLNANYICTLNAATLTNALYNLNVASISAGLPVYLKGRIQRSNDRDVFLLNPSDYFSQSLPTNDDGYVYWHIGGSVSSSTVQFNTVQPLYYFRNGRVRVYEPGQYDAERKISISGDTSITLTVEHIGATFILPTFTNGFDVLLTQEVDTKSRVGAEIRFVCLGSMAKDFRIKGEADTFITIDSISPRVFASPCGMIILRKMADYDWVTFTSSMVS